MQQETLSIYAPSKLDWLDSYGLMSLQLARHLTRQGVYVNLLPAGDRIVDNQPADVQAIASQPIHAEPGGLVLGYCTAYPRYDAYSRQGPRVAISMFESSRLPEGWIGPVNECDALIVPSRFCRNVFRECGATLPIYVCPLGVGDVYQPRPEGSRRSTGRPLTFLAFLDRGRRKGGLYAEQAFVRAFGDDPNVRLILKSRAARQESDRTNPNIELVQADLTEQELYELYLRCDVLINPNRGEGFGLLPREFASTGGISLATDWGGTADDINLWGWPLPYTLVDADWSDAKRLAGQDLGQWAEPDVDGIAERLRDVADRIHYYRAIARQHAPMVRQRYSWVTFAADVLAVWRRVKYGMAHDGLQRAAA